MTGGRLAYIFPSEVMRPLYTRREFGMMTLGLLGSAAVGAKAGRPSPAVLSLADETFLKDQARRIVESARLPAGARAGDRRNTTPYDLHVPGGNMGYPAFWVRDAVMMLGGDFISAAEVEGWVRLIASTLRGPVDWTVRPGVIVPAYSVPDHVNFDGQPTFFPGNYETGDKQGGHPWGKYPPLDDAFYFIGAVAEHLRLTGRPDLLHSKVKTSFSEEPLLDLCEKVFWAVPADPTTGLVVSGDIKTENAKDWGFCDGIFKSGQLLFPSLLRFQAALRLAAMLEACGKKARGADYRRESVWIGAALGPAFFRQVQPRDEAWLHSATIVGNQPDVWGSAFAVHIGILDEADARSVSHALTRAYREKTAVRGGYVRHILTTDKLNKGGWESASFEIGKYQNGGYWGTPVGWYISAVSKTDPAAASELAAEYVRFLRENRRPDGLAQAWEWLNPDTGERSNPLYMASVALPYLSLKEAGLLGGR